jgi:hypothetical protein
MSLDSTGRRIAGPRVARAAKGTGIGECAADTELVVYGLRLSRILAVRYRAWCAWSLPC